MKRRSLCLAALLVTLAVTLTGCSGTSDPSVVQSYEPCGPFDLESDGVTGRVYHPSGADCSVSVYSPLVVIFHAAGTQPTYGFDDYDYLQEHLARNGFISVSIDVLSAPDDQLAAAAAAWDYVEGFLWSTWSKRFYINPGSIGIIGHSRGGVTARFLAQYLADNPLFQVRSVVSLAPASSSDILTGLETEGYLSIYGTNDCDTMPFSTFGRYDQAGSDDSQRDPAVNQLVLYKALKLIEGGTHLGYSDLGAPQSDAVKGYVLAFLKRHNADDATWYEDYIRGDAVPGDGSNDVWSQYSDGLHRRVIDHFDDGEVANTTLGGSLTTFEATAQVLDLSTALTTYVHGTHALWTWGSSDGAAVTWSIPEGKRDASEFRWMSLRIGQASGDPANDLRIQIRSAGEWSPEVRLTDHGRIAQPLDMCFTQPPPPCQPRTFMATIRVPLTAFGDHTDVDFVRLRFRGDSTVHTFILDNLEFSESVYEPWQTTI